MAKDKAFGFVIFLFGLLLIVFYIFWGPVSLLYENNADTMSGLDWLYNIRGFNWQWAVVLPLTLGIICIGLLAAWIGYPDCDFHIWAKFHDYHAATSSVRRIRRRIRS